MFYTEKLANYVKNGNYEKIIDFNNAHGFKIANANINNEVMKNYFLLVGASYQELGNLDFADKYFDLFLNYLTLSNEQIQIGKDNGIDINSIKLIGLITELEKLGLTYKYKD